MVGLSRKAAALDDVLAQDLEDVYSPGDLVRAKVLHLYPPMPYISYITHPTAFTLTHTS